MIKGHADATRQLARLERTAVILDRFHDELRALPNSARTARLVRANRTAVARIEERAVKTRDRLEKKPAAAAAS